MKTSRKLLVIGSLVFGAVFGLGACTTPPGSASTGPTTGTPAAAMTATPTPRGSVLVPPTVTVAPVVPTVAVSPTVAPVVPTVAVSPTVAPVVPTVAVSPTAPLFAVEVLTASRPVTLSFGAYTGTMPVYTALVAGKRTTSDFDVTLTDPAKDLGCEITESDGTHIGEVVSSPAEKCWALVEWSLKQGDATIMSGVYLLAPGQWHYATLAVSGMAGDGKGNIRFVGSIWRLPNKVNPYQDAVKNALARDVRDGTWSILGLSLNNADVVSIGLNFFSRFGERP